VAGGEVDPRGVPEVAAGGHDDDVAVVPERIERAVGGGVVRDDDAHPGGAGLGPKARHQCLDVVGAVVGHHEDGDLGAAAGRHEASRPSLAGGPGGHGRRGGGRPAGVRRSR
jgi:hypothetical protein